jgi:hypothetical protein
MIFNDFVAIYMRIWTTWMKLILMCDINYMNATWKYRWTCKHNKHILRVKERKSCGWWPMKHYLNVVSNWPPHRCNYCYSWNFGDTIAIGSMAEFMVILTTWMKVLKCGWNCKYNKYTWGWKKDIDETWMAIIAIEFMDEIHHINVISHVDETIWRMVTFPFTNKSLSLS